jgi:pimeloyl-ACP methyl ester carboxylesterase
MLRTEPSSDPDRYATLRSDFIRFGCAAHRHLLEQRATPGSAEPATAPGNLICTLPGRYAPRIIVAASYPRPSGNGAGPSGWAEPVLLPILYQALQAQTRNLTWVFAELAGEDGQRAFLDSLRTGPPPLAIVLLDSLGASMPGLQTAGPHGDLQVHQILEDQARRIAALQGAIHPGKDHRQQPELDPGPSAKAFEEALREIPHVIVHSARDPVLPPPAFHQNFEFLAYYLCALDLKLNPLSDTGDQ